jgi:cation:H+ antiporter
VRSLEEGVLLTVVELVVSLLAILAAAVFFTNAVEMLGDRMNLAQGAVGSVLAAVGTALPETMIPIVAILGAVISGSGAESAGEIGVGAILGAPFLLTTLAMFVIGVSVLGFRGRRRNGTNVVIDEGSTGRDMVFFLIFFALAAGAGIVDLPFALKVGLGVVLIGAYALYIRRTILAGGISLEEVPEKLRLWPFGSRAPTWAVVGQMLLSLVVMGFGAHFFVDAVGHGSEALGIPAGLVALVLAPLATELPEKFNSVIWLREDKDTLALGNITGAMVFQSTIPVSVGIIFTPWNLDFISAFSAVLALLAGAAFFLLLLRKGPVPAWPLLFGGAFYAVFLGAAIYSVVIS